MGVVGPDSGEIVSLQLQPHGRFVSGKFIAASPDLIDLVHEPGQDLNMVGDLVGNDVGLGEVTGCLVTLGQLIKKRRVDIDNLVRRAIERPYW